MKIAFSSTFKKAFKKKGLSEQSLSEFWNRVNMFIADPFDKRLKTHKLSDKMKKLWSFSIEYDIRVVFYFTDEKPQSAVFIDIGTHDDVY
jgi:mRNA-degrading endonuclease YafQ of YafQ-DinJ toxin-antitoxin module